MTGSGGLGRWWSGKPQALKVECAHPTENPAPGKWRWPGCPLLGGGSLGDWLPLAAALGWPRRGCTTTGQAANRGRRLSCRRKTTGSPSCLPPNTTRPLCKPARRHTRLKFAGRTSSAACHLSIPHRSVMERGSRSAQAPRWPGTAPSQLAPSLSEYPRAREPWGSTTGTSTSAARLVEMATAGAICKRGDFLGPTSFSTEIINRDLVSAS